MSPAPRSNKEVSPDTGVQDVREGAKDGKKRRKQHRQETATTTGNDDGINK
jgi:hypothetical protein